MVWPASGHPGTRVRRIDVQMPLLLPLHRIAQCIIYPSKGDRQDVCGDRSIPASQRFSGPGLNAAGESACSLQE
jgi:hypothetical protein